MEQNLHVGLQSEPLDPPVLLLAVPQRRTRTRTSRGSVLLVRTPRPWNGRRESVVFSAWTKDPSFTQKTLVKNYSWVY